MAPRIQPSLIKNKVKRQEVSAKRKKAINQQKLKKRLARAKEEANDPTAKKVGTIVLDPTNLPIVQFYDRKE
jgi:ribosome production factor 1